MSPENVNPSEERSGDISEDELKKILGDDYDSVVGGDEGTEAPTPGEIPARKGEPAPARAGAGNASTPQGADAAGKEQPATPNMTPAEAEAWAKQMEQELDAEPSQAGQSSPPQPAPQIEQPIVQAVQFAQLENGGARQDGCIDVLMDVKLPISVELGRTEMLVKEILNCGPGTVIELNKLAGEPVDVLVNGRKVANGEVVVVDEHFGIRLTNLISPKDRVRSLA